MGTILTELWQIGPLMVSLWSTGHVSMFGTTLVVFGQH